MQAGTAETCNRPQGLIIMYIHITHNNDNNRCKIVVVAALIVIEQTQQRPALEIQEGFEHGQHQRGALYSAACCARAKTLAISCLIDYKSHHFCRFLIQSPIDKLQAADTNDGFGSQRSSKVFESSLLRVAVKGSRSSHYCEECTR